MNENSVVSLRQKDEIDDPLIHRSPIIVSSVFPARRRANRR